MKKLLKTRLVFSLMSFIMLFQVTNAQGKYNYKNSADILEDDKIDNQKAAILLSQIGEYRLSDSLYGEYVSPEQVEIPSNIDDYDAKHAISALSALFPRNRIVIFNEAHHVPRHRFFVRQVLDSLCNNGYQYLALEALCQYAGEMCDSDLPKRKFALNSFKTGVLTREPQFANLIRDAIEIGFKIVSYEAIDRSKDQDRELLQAQKIANIFEEDSLAKVVVLCGFSHLIEDEKLVPTPSGKDNWMAAHLKRITGIDPLTINQVSFTESEANSMFFEKNRAQNESFVLQHSSAKNYYSNGYGDICIFHPVTDYYKNKPAWMELCGSNLVKYKVSEIDSDSFPLLVLCYLDEEFRANSEEQPVPIEIVEYFVGNRELYLFLPKNKDIRIITKDRRGNNINEEVKQFDTP